MDNLFAQKKWFTDWVTIDDEMKAFKDDVNNLLVEIILTEIDGTESLGSMTGDVITEETLVQMCDLTMIPDTPKSFFKKEIKGKTGSVESKFKEIILKALNEERFISYFSSYEVPNLIPYQCGNLELLQMVEEYHAPGKFPKKHGTKGWYMIMSNKYSNLQDRVSVLITDKSLYQFRETKSYQSFQVSQTELRDITIAIFSDKSGYFNLHFRPIEGVLRSKRLLVNRFLPKLIVHDNDEFCSEIEQIGIESVTRRILQVDEKIKSFLNQKLNNPIERLNQMDNYYFVLKNAKDILGRDRFKIEESAIVDSLHFGSLEFYRVYINLIGFRDSLLRMYKEENHLLLEKALSEFENSLLSMSRFEQNTITLLQEINENIETLTRITHDGLSEISNDFSTAISKLVSLNESNEELVEGLSASNFIGLVNAFQLYRISKNTKSLRE